MDLPLFGPKCWAWTHSSGQQRCPTQLAAVAAPTHSPSSASSTPFQDAAKGHSNIVFPLDQPDFPLMGSGN